MSFLHHDLLLDGGRALRYYRERGATSPLTARCTPDFVTALCEDRLYQNAAELMLCDPARQALMRLAGVEERFITGDGSDYEKFRFFCTVMGDLAGNPIKLQANAELQLLFDCPLAICEAHCDAIWALIGERLLAERFTARTLLQRCRIGALLCPLAIDEDPADFAIAAKACSIPVLPIFCPDALLDPAAAAFPKAVKALGISLGRDISSLPELESALCAALDRFAAVGCRAAVHSVLPQHFLRPDPYHAAKALEKALSRELLEAGERALLAAQLWRTLGREYQRRDMLLELSCDVGSALPDSLVFHTVSGDIHCEALQLLLDYLQERKGLSRIAIYLSDPAHAAQLARLAARYPAIGEDRPQIRLGVMLGTPAQTRARLEALASVIPISSVIGSFAAPCYGYSLLNEELFRRLFCTMLADWYEEGLLPSDEETDLRILTRVGGGLLDLAHDIEVLWP